MSLSPSSVAAPGADVIYSAQLLECTGLPPNSLVEFALQFVTEHELAMKEKRRVADIEPIARSTLWSVDGTGRCAPPAMMSAGAVEQQQQEEQQQQQSKLFYDTLLSANVHRRQPDVRQLQVKVAANRTRGAHDGLASPMVRRGGGERVGAVAPEEIEERERLLLCPVHDADALAAIEAAKRKIEEDEDKAEAALAKLYGDTSAKEKAAAAAAAAVKNEDANDEVFNEKPPPTPPSCICSSSLIDEADPPAGCCTIGGSTQLFGAKWLTLQTKKSSSNKAQLHGEEEGDEAIRIRVAWSCSGLATKHTSAVQFASADTPTHVYLHNSFQQHLHRAVHDSKSASCGVLSSPVTAASVGNNDAAEMDGDDQQQQQQQTPAATFFSKGEQERRELLEKDRELRSDTTLTTNVSLPPKLSSTTTSSSTKQQQQQPLEFERQAFPVSNLDSNSSLALKKMFDEPLPNEQQQQQQAAAQQPQPQQPQGDDPTSASASASAAVAIAASVSRLESVLTEFAKNFHARISSLEGRMDSMERRHSTIAAHLSLENAHPHSPVASPTTGGNRLLGNVVNASEALAILQMQQAYVQQQPPPQHSPGHSSSTSSGGGRKATTTAGGQQKTRTTSAAAAAAAAAADSAPINFTAVGVPPVRSASSSPNTSGVMRRGGSGSAAPAAAGGGGGRAVSSSSSSLAPRGVKGNNNNNNDNSMRGSVLQYGGGGRGGGPTTGSVSATNRSGSNNHLQQQQQQQYRARSQQQHQHQQHQHQQRLASLSNSNRTTPKGATAKRTTVTVSQQQHHHDPGAGAESASEYSRSELDFEIINGPKILNNNNNNSSSYATNGNGNNNSGPPPRVLVATPSPVIRESADPLPEQQQQQHQQTRTETGAAPPVSALRAIYDAPTQLSSEDQARLAGYQPPPSGPFRSSAGGITTADEIVAGRGAAAASDINDVNRDLGRNSGSGGAGHGTRGGLVIGNANLHPLNDLNRFIHRVVTSEDDELVDPATRTFPIGSLAREMME